MLSFGGFLNSTFWSTYRCPGSQSIEELLNNEDCNVDKLLADDDVLQEFKNLNEKLISYFDHERLAKLVEYITVMPPLDADHQRGHKFPFIASEIFNCEINQILDKFFEAPEKKKPVEVHEDEEDDTVKEESTEASKRDDEEPDEDKAPGDGEDKVEKSADEKGEETAEATGQSESMKIEEESGK